MMRHRCMEPIPSRPPLPPPAPTMLRISTDGAVIDFPRLSCGPTLAAGLLLAGPTQLSPAAGAELFGGAHSTGDLATTRSRSSTPTSSEFGADLPIRTGRKGRSLPIHWYGILLSRSRYELIAHGLHLTPDHMIESPTSCDPVSPTASSARFRYHRHHPLGPLPRHVYTPRRRHTSPGDSDHHRRPVFIAMTVQGTVVQAQEPQRSLGTPGHAGPV